MPTIRAQPDSPDFVHNHTNSNDCFRAACNLNFSAKPNTMSLPRDFQTSDGYVDEMMALYDQFRQLNVEDQIRLLQRANQPPIPINMTTSMCLPDCPQTCGFCGVYYHRCQTKFPNVPACEKCCTGLVIGRNHLQSLQSDPSSELTFDRLPANLLGTEGNNHDHFNALQMNNRRPVRSITNRRQPQLSPEFMSSLASHDRSRSRLEQSMLPRSTMSQNVGQDEGIQDIFTRVDHFNVASVDGASVPKRKTSHKKLVINSKVRRIMVGHAKKFGQYGNNPGELSEPSGVATNNKGEILVVDSNNRRINIYNSTGEHLRSIEGQDPNSTSVMFANRIAICPISGNIIITERPPTKVGKILSPSGLLLKKFGEGIIEHPRGLAVDRCGRILVLQSMVGRVDIFSMDGEPLTSFHLAMDFPFSIATNKYEEIFVADNKKHLVKVYDYKGNHLRDIGGEGVTNFPVGVNIGKNDEVVVCDNHNNFNITIFDRQGNPIVGLKGEIKHTQCYGVTLTDNYEIILCSKDYEVCKYQIEPKHLDRNNQLIFYKGENELDDDDLDNDFSNATDYVHPVCNNNDIRSSLSNNNNNNNGLVASGSNESLSARLREFAGRTSSLGLDVTQRMMPTTSSLNSPSHFDGIPFTGALTSAHLTGAYAKDGLNVGMAAQRINQMSNVNTTDSLFDMRSMPVGTLMDDPLMMQFRAPGGPVVSRHQNHQMLFGQIAMPAVTSATNPFSRLPNMSTDSQSRFNNFNIRGPR